jgi:hypothetical protein
MTSGRLGLLAALPLFGFAPTARAAHHRHDSLKLAYPASITVSSPFTVTLTGSVSAKARIDVYDADVPCHDALEDTRSRSIDFTVVVAHTGSFDLSEGDTYSAGPPFFVCGYVLGGRHGKVLAHSNALEVKESAPGVLEASPTAY